MISKSVWNLPFRATAPALVCWLASCLFASAQSPSSPGQSAETTSTAETVISTAPCTDCQAVVDWTKIPPVRPPQRAGNFVIPPTDCGYYSLLDAVQDRFRDKAPPMPYGIFGFVPTSAFDLDFRFMDQPNFTSQDPWTPLKRIHLGDDWMIATGGQSWVRTMNEVDSRLTANDNNYTLFRFRPFVDVWYQDRIRFFAEFIYADSFFSDLNPLRIDINRSDLLNLFMDLRLAKFDDGSAYLRIGRQELIYGSQRLISTLDWANTRRTFQGIKAFYQGKDWDLDAFWVQPVIPDRNEIDSVDNNQNFFGLWATRKIRKGTAIDFYYLGLDNTNPTAIGFHGVRGGQTVHTLGTRCYGDKEQFLWDTELMVQFGTYSNQDKFAGSAVQGVGYHFKDLPWTPQVWAYVDWASGEDNPRLDGTNSTFNQLFPFGHYYFGFVDQVARQNILDLYSQVAFYPNHWITGIIQFHHFTLDSSRDALYNAAGTPIRQDLTGRAGRNVGNELDLLLSMQLTDHSNFLVGWSKLFSGSFIEKTGPDVSPELFYVQYSLRW